MLASKKKLGILSLAILLSYFMIKGDNNNEGYLTINTHYTANFSADFDYVNERWLVVYEKNDKIYGRFVSLNKTFFTGEFELSNLGCSATEKCFDPNIKFGCDGGTCKFLIAYVRGSKVYYNMLDDDDGNSLFTNPMTVSPLPSTYPSVEFDYINKRFFVVFSEEITQDNSDVSGILVNFSDGLTFGSKISISSAFRNQIKPSVAFSESLSYIVVWQDHRADDRGDIYYQFISKDGQRIGENSGVGLFPSRHEVNPYVFWLPSINRFVVLYKTSIVFVKPGESEECPIIAGNITCTEGNYVYSFIDSSGRVSFPVRILPNANISSETEHYARMGTNYIIFAGDAYYSMDKRKHFAIMRFDTTTPKYILSNPTFWFPNYYRVKVGLVSISEPLPDEPFCPPIREHPNDSLITIEPSSFTLEEKRTKTRFPVLFPRGMYPGDHSAKIFVSATTYPGINTALVIFGVSFTENLSLVTIDTDPVMFDYEYLSQTSLPVAVTNTCYISYGQPPCPGCPCTGEYQIKVTGGKPPYTFQAVAGQMPPGLTVNYQGTITGFVLPPDIGSVCETYPCPFTFSVLVSDSSNPKKSSCMTFDTLLFPSPEVRLSYPEQISFCTKATESKSDNIFIQNLGTPVTIQILEPKMISFGDSATCSTVTLSTFPFMCSPAGSSIAPFYLEIYSQQTTVGNGCTSTSCPWGKTCDCRQFKYELYPGHSISGKIHFSSNFYGEYTTKITFHVVDSVLGYSESHTINVKAFTIAQDLFVTSDMPISPSGCTNYTSVCTTYNIDLGNMYVGQSTSFYIYLGNAVTSASNLGCSGDVYLEVLTVFASPNQSFSILSPPPSEFGTIGPVSIPSNSTRPIAIQVSGVSAGSITYPIIIYSDDPDERRVVVVVRAYFNPVSFNVPSIVDCGINLRGYPPLPCYIEIQNQSPVSVPVNSIGISGSSQFYVTGTTSFEVPPFSTYMLQVSFGSSATGVHFGVLTLYMNSAPFFVSVGLRGQVIDKDDLLKIEPSSLDFGNVITGASIASGIRFINMSLYDLYVSPIYIDSPFSFPSASSVYIPAGQEKSIAVNFVPTSAGTFTSAALFTVSTSRFSYILTYPVSGTGVLPPAVLRVPSSVNCGTYLISSAHLQCYIEIQNTSSVPSAIHGINISGSDAFYLTGSTSFTISPYYTYSLVVSFGSSVAGIHSGNLVIHSNSITPVISVNLLGRAVDRIVRVEPEVLDFGTAVTGAEIRSNFKIINMTDQIVYVIPSYIDVPFSFADPSSRVIHPSKDINFAIDFKPLSAGTFTSAARFTVSTGGFSYTLTYPVSGTAVTPESVGLKASLRMIPNYINFGDVIICSPVRCPVSIRSLNIINTGNVPINLVSFSHPSNVSNYSITTPLSITDFYVTDFVARALNTGGAVGNIVFNFSSTAGSFSAVVTFYINGVSPAISVSPDSISFGAVKVGEESIFMLSVSNTGNYKLTVTNISIGQPFFSDVPVPFEIQAGESRRIPISFRPREVSSYETYIRIYSDAPYSEVLTVQISGRGEENPLPVADVSPKSIDFGKVRMGQTRSEVFTIRNLGTSKLFVSSISSLAQEFVLKLDQILPLAIDSNNSVTFVITFSPSDEKVFDSFVVLKTNDANKPEIRISVKGEGANPHIRVPSEVNFGGVRRGKTVKKEFPIENTGNLPLQAEISITKDDEFVFISDYIGEVTEKFSITIPEKSSSKLDIYFTPPGLEKYRATITIKSDDPLYPFIEVPVSGEGGFPVLSMNVNEIDFGEIYIDERKEYEVSVSNLGSAPLEVTFYVNDQVFGVSVSSFVVPSREVYNVKFIFAPNGKEGVFSSPVKVITDDPKNSELEITLKGRAKRFSYIPIGSGCSCSSASPFSLDMFLILISVLFFFVRSGLLKKLIRLFVFTLIFCFLIFSHRAYSQDISLNINNFYPYQDISNFSFLRTAHFRPKRTLGWGGFLSFAKDPLMLKVAKGEQSISKQTIVNYSIYSGVVLSYVPVEKLEVGTFLPVSIVGGVKNQFSLSDIFLEAKYLVFSEKDLFSLSLNPQIGIPTFGGDFASNRSISPRLGFIISRETKLGDFLLNTSGNIGFEYRSERAVADLNVGSQTYFMLGGSLSFRQINFSFETISFISLEEVRKETIPAEALISVGGEFSDLKVRIGGGGGLTQGIGSPKYRLFVIFTYDLQPSVPPIKYMRVEGRVLDNLGREVQKGVVYVQESGVSSQIKDGKFEMELPDGRWTFKVVSPGYETKIQSFLIPDQKPEINVRKLDPQIVIAPTDRFGISQTIELNIKTPEGVIKTSSDIAAISTSGNIDIQTKDISRSVVLPPDEIIWINLIHRQTVETNKEQQAQPQQQETKQRGKQDITAKKGRTKETQQQRSAQPQRAGAQPENLAQKRDLEKTEKLPETQLETTETTVKDNEQQRSSEESVLSQKPSDKPKEKTTEIPSVERIVGEKGKITEKIPSRPSKPSEEVSERGKTEVFEPKIQTQEKIVTKEHISKEQGKNIERERKNIYTEQIGEEQKIEEQRTSVVSLPKKEEIKKEETAVIPFKFEEKKELESKLSLLISKVFDSFTVNRWDIPKSAYDDLDKVAQIILENKDRISSIRIEGHTDITGPEYWNVELSYLRANEIRRYLYKKGVKIPIEIIGYSYMRPIDTNETEEGRRKNRRTEVKVFSEGE
ncbi:MAG: choice-of-anchor D domain-containing protein [Candidatus Calescibacterium sp.]|nr:choice-of-anchor D domain-containing protein [Candidatus Calescibacterium sp.]